jgi:hypothetical protein
MKRVRRLLDQVLMSPAFLTPSHNLATLPAGQMNADPQSGRLVVKAWFHSEQLAFILCSTDDEAVRAAFKFFPLADSLDDHLAEMDNMKRRGASPDPSGVRGKS